MNNSTGILKTCTETVKLIDTVIPNYIKLLCVDDDPNDPLFLSAILSRSKKVNYRTETAHTYTDGLILIKQRKHDIYFIDFKLHGRDGLDLIEECIKLGHTGPFVVWSGYIDDRIYERAVASKVNYISKDESNVYILDNLIRYTIKNWQINNAVLKLKGLVNGSV